MKLVGRMIIKGDRVRLTNIAIIAKNRRRHRVTWQGREGTVISASVRCIRIMWDGNTWTDQLSPKIVERIDAGNEVDARQTDQQARLVLRNPD